MIRDAEKSMCDHICVCASTLVNHVVVDDDGVYVASDHDNNDDESNGASDKNVGADEGCDE